MERKYQITQQIPKEINGEQIIENILLTEISFDITTEMGNIYWNSETGLITYKQKNKHLAIPYTGNGIVQLQPGYPVIVKEWGYNNGQLEWCDSNTLTLHYRYWYY